MTGAKRQTITPQDFRDVARDFHVTVPEQFLYEKTVWSVRSIQFPGIDTGKTAVVEPNQAD